MEMHFLRSPAFAPGADRKVESFRFAWTSISRQAYSVADRHSDRLPAVHFCQRRGISFQIKSEDVSHGDQLS